MLMTSFVGQTERGSRNLSLHNILKLTTGLRIDPGELVRTHARKMFSTCGWIVTYSDPQPADYRHQGYAGLRALVFSLIEVL